MQKDAVQIIPSSSSTERIKYLVAAQNCKKGMYECALYIDHVNSSCPCYNFNNFCKHSICISEIAGIRKEHLEHSKKSPRRWAPSKSSLVDPAKKAHGKKSGSNKNRKAAQASTDHPFTQIHHNNNPFVLCFLDHIPNAKECRQCRIEFPQREKITPFDIVSRPKWCKPQTTISEIY